GWRYGNETVTATPSNRASLLRIPTQGLNSRRYASPSTSNSKGSHRRSALAATHTTTPSWRRSTAYIRPNASTPQYSTTAPTKPSLMLNTPRPNGSTVGEPPACGGTTTDGSTVVSVTPPQVNVRPPTTRLSTGNRDPQNSGRKPRTLRAGFLTSAPRRRWSCAAIRPTTVPTSPPLPDVLAPRCR